MKIWDLQSEMAIINRVNAFRLDDLEMFDSMVPVDLAHYVSVEKPWLRREMRLLKQRIRREPSETDLARFIIEQHASLRFRAYYTLRFPDRVRFIRKTFPMAS